MSLKLRAYAKINLSLEVLFKRDDSYHEVTTVLQTISLCDTLHFEYSESLELQGNIPELPPDDNLVLKAAGLLQEDAGCDKGALIQLTKDIPLSAGLGSGATDAAATLKGLNTLWELNLPTERLAGLAAKLGSDVAFFLYRGTALAHGRGEIVTPLPPVPELCIVLLCPPIEPVPGKTGQLYSRLNPSHFTTGRSTEKLVDHLHAGAAIDVSLLFNVFEEVAFDFFTGLSDFRSRFLSAGAEKVHLAGAGPTLFTIVRDEARGETILSNLEADGLEAYLVHTVEALPSAAGGASQC